MLGGCLGACNGKCCSPTNPDKACCRSNTLLSPFREVAGYFYFLDGPRMLSVRIDSSEAPSGARGPRESSMGVVGRECNKLCPPDASCIRRLHILGLRIWGSLM